MSDTPASSATVPGPPSHARWAPSLPAFGAEATPAGTGPAAAASAPPPSPRDRGARAGAFGTVPASGVHGPHFSARREGQDLGTQAGEAIEVVCCAAFGEPWEAGTEGHVGARRVPQETNRRPNFE